MNPVPPNVLQAFGLTGIPKPLTGGEGTSWIVDSTVFKPVRNAALHEWSSRILTNLSPTGFRVPAPLRSSEGSFTFQGWAATAYEPGKHAAGRWDEKRRVCQAFHQALLTIPTPPMPPAADRWSRAHRIAWEEDRLPPAAPDEILDVIRGIFDRYDPVAPENQVVHGDLCGNILCSPILPPLVIDFSPAYRPALYAEAILVADAVAWEGAPLTLRDSFLQSTVHRQMLIRAVNFRLIVAALHFKDDASAFRLEHAGYIPVLQGL